MRAPTFPLLLFFALTMPWVAERAHAAPATGSVAIPEPAELEADVQFWMRVYSEVTTNEGFVHDARNLAVVYEALHFEPGLPTAQRQQQVNAAREHYQELLKRLAAGEQPLPGNEADVARVRAMWGDVLPARLGEAADDVRFQLGQADRFRAGLVRSGAWEKHIARTLAAQGIPPEIAVLPHVESSFQPEAYSKAGAAGMWQFIRSTGRRFLRIDRVVDERLDPYRSSEAAAQLLTYNYGMLGSWPLAITAYNSGAGGMRRARDQLGTDDIVRIVRDYHGPSFGFASRNYYVSFLAALRLDREPEKYFGSLQRQPESNTGELPLPAAARVDALERALGVQADVLRALNPALRPPVWLRQQPIPRGYHLRLPATAGVPDPQQLLARLGAPPGTPTLNPASAVAVASLVGDGAGTTGMGVSLPPLAPAAFPSPPRIPLANATRPRRGGKAPAAPVPEPGPEPMLAPAAVPRAEPVHDVLAGESVASIAQAAGIEPERLLRLNSLTLDDRIYEGQQLLVGDVAAAGSDAAEEALAAADDRRDELQASAALAAERSAPALSAEQALAQGPRLSPAPSAQAVADPIDYGVQADGSVQVAAAETIGHYADWLGLAASQVRALNKLSAKAGVRVGQRLALDFSQATRVQFERRRRAYHAQLQSAYFATHRIEATTAYAARAGDSLWQIARRAGVPDWLLQQYNPDVDFNDLRPGTALQLPKVEAGE